MLSAVDEDLEGREREENEDGEDEAMVGGGGDCCETVKMVRFADGEATRSA